MNANVWIGLKQSAVDILRPLLDDSEYDGPHLTAVKIFRRMTDIATVENLFKKPTLGGDVYQLFSVNFNQIEGDTAQKIQDAFDYLETNYLNQFAVVGAWWWDGRQIGTQWVDEADHSQGTTGTPLYPINATQLVKFMPDVWNGDDPPTYSAATVLTDVNLIQGQSQRRFV